ncbi:polysaccharide synthesis protein GtrA [Nostocales cyanobacterium HT-58-2]|nr:polysaccharide synthesis protein GtrA [Nostocales cyanobacterium HT-58-2]
MINKTLKKKVFRYLVCGVLSAIFNVLALAIIIKVLDAKTPIIRNFANIISIEISLLFSFFLYKKFVWGIELLIIKGVTLQQIFRYHLSVMIAIGSRVFVFFPLLDWLGIHYSVNTLIGIALGSFMTYTMTDKWVFKKNLR